MPDNNLDGQVNNYGFRAPLLLVFEEERQDMDQRGGLRPGDRAGEDCGGMDTSVLFVYPTAQDGWAGADERLYAAVIAEVKMIQVYRDGIVENYDFFAKAFKGYFIRGAIFRADIYSFGASADYVATHLLNTVQGEYLWGPGEITPAMCSMERLSIVPDVQRRDIAVLSVGNSEEINRAFEGCEHLLIKEKADYEADFHAFVKRFKMWCGKIEMEPDFQALGMTEDAGSHTVRTAPDNHCRHPGPGNPPGGLFRLLQQRDIRQRPGTARDRFPRRRRFLHVSDLCGRLVGDGPSVRIPVCVGGKPSWFVTATEAGCSIPAERIRPCRSCPSRRPPAWSACSMWRRSIG